MRVFADLAEGLLDLVFAPCCAACGDPIATRSPDRLVCALCWSRSRRIPPPTCERCATPLEPSASSLSSCPLCPDLRPAILGIRSAYLLDGPPRRLVHALKYRGWHDLARPMAARMLEAELPRASREDIELVVPVPLARARRRQRGYNQAELLAREISRKTAWPIRENVLVRSTASGSQTTLHPDQRRANVAGAFRVEDGQSGVLFAAHVLLVDDVWTTGATTRSCADALLDAGARAVTVLTFARALPQIERLAGRLERISKQALT